MTLVTTSGSRRVGLLRKIWREYFPKIDAIVYLVDAADPSRFAESRAEFDRIMSTAEIGK